MALTGDALLAIWHDIEPAARDDYMEWHTREHMPERLSIPGFTVGKRLINHDLARYRYGTLYGGESLEVFRSPAYLERLNNPTDWSLRVQPMFRNFLRVACIRLASCGVGEGRGVATVRLDLADGGEQELRRGAYARARAVADHGRRLRPCRERAFDAWFSSKATGAPSSKRSWGRSSGPSPRVGAA